MSAPGREGRLSDEEFEQFLRYLDRFVDHDLDLFEQWEVGDPDHPAYVLITRDPLGELEYRRRSP